MGLVDEIVRKAGEARESVQKAAESSTDKLAKVVDDMKVKTEFVSFKYALEDSIAPEMNRLLTQYKTVDVQGLLFVPNEGYFTLCKVTK